MDISVKEPEEYIVAIVDDEIDLQKEQIFQNKKDFIQDGIKFSLNFYDNPKKFIESFEFLKIAPNAILVDINFENCGQEEMKGIPGPKDKAGIEIIKILKKIDPSIPILAFTSIYSPDIVFSIGRELADDYIQKITIQEEIDESNENVPYTLCRKIRKTWLNNAKNPIFDKVHQEVADDFAKDYDEKEQEKIATVAYYHFENKIILEAINEILNKKNKGEKINIIDLGCGCGRIEQLLEQEITIKDRINILAIDFSANMLKCLKNKNIDLPNLTIQRGPAEKLFEYNAQLQEVDKYDLIIAGFGFFSYCNYKMLLPSFKNGLGGIASFLKNGGKLFFSVYNENSLIYDVVSGSNLKNDEFPIAAVADLNAGVLRVDEREFVCETFNKDRFVRLLRQSGLFVDISSVFTFPTIHLCLNNQHCSNSITPGFVRAGDPLFAKGYFNKDYYDQDVICSHYLKDKGHYIIGFATRIK